MNTKVKVILALTAWAALGMVLVGRAWAVTCTVSNTNDTGAGSLRAAVQACCVDGTGTVDATGVSGAITLTIGQLLITKTCTITGPGTASLTVNGDDDDNLLNVLPESTAALTIAHVTLSHGSPAIVVQHDATLIATDVVFSANDRGIALNGALGGATITDSVFSANVGTTNGIGMFQSDNGSEVSGSVNLVRDVFIDNHTDSCCGAGFDSFTAGSTSVQDCSFTNNIADGSGGNALGAQSSGGFLITGSTFAGNNDNTAGDGGAIEVDAPLIIANSTFQGNATGGTGGAITAYSDTTLINVTLSGNTAANGGTLEAHGAAITISNSIVNGGTPNNCITGSGGSIVDGGHNIDSGNTCGFSTHDTDPKLNVLGSYGGPTQTMSLQALSPAINGGDDAVCAASPVSGLDQRGATRPGVGQTHCSIGAYEEQASASCQQENPVGQSCNSGAGVCCRTVDGVPVCH